MSWHRMEELTWEQLDRFDRCSTLLLLPLGPLEAHGPHLPLGTDWLAAGEIAAAAAAGIAETDPALEVITLPAHPVGSAAVAADFPGTLSLRGETLRRLIVDLGRSLARHGFRCLLIVNHHLDPVHMGALLAAGDTLAAEGPLRVAEVLSRSVYARETGEIERFVQRLGLEAKFEIHADAKETALARYRFPELVQEPEADLPPVHIDVVDGLRKGCRSFREMGALRGYIGSPAAATAELGRCCFEEQVRWSCELGLALLRGADLPPIPPRVRRFLARSLERDGTPENGPPPPAGENR